MRSTDREGYGHISHRGTLKKASRLMYSLAHGAIPVGKVVRHTCDTPACANPDHLVLATQGDNIRDAFAKGRIGRRDQRGERHNMAKLTDAKVRGIRKLYATGCYSTYTLARRFGVGQGHICQIILRRYWKHVL
jgi:hypothetical protein